jgi:hypothetical protein
MEELADQSEFATDVSRGLKIRSEVIVLTHLG